MRLESYPDDYDVLISGDILSSPTDIESVFSWTHIQTDEAMGAVLIDFGAVS